MSKRIVLLGAGTMALDIAIEAASYDYTVSVWYYRDIHIPEKKLESKLQKAYSRNGISMPLYENIKSHIEFTSNLAICSQGDIIIETIVENEKSKVRLFEEIKTLVPEKAIICTNTSSLSITQLSCHVVNREKFAGLHFFNPVSRMQLVEIVQGQETSNETLDLLKDFVISLKKEYIVTKDSPGFIVNRLLFVYLNHAVALLEENIASIEDIDKAMRFGANYPIGPFALCDLIGIDVVYDILCSLHHQLQKDTFLPCHTLKRMIEQGKLGKKSGEGFYIYK